MKKYKMINFISKDKQLENIKNILTLAVVTVIFVGVNNVINNKEEIQANDDMEVFEEINEYEEINQVSNIYVNFKPIKLAYDIIGKENITKILYEGNNLDIEGTCENLNLLEKFRNESNCTDFSINNISKTNNGYLFNLNCSLGA